jgi:hypothetical protein
MALQVIGAGFGRTGTLSLKVALERLGFGPCYHMVEVIRNPEHALLWRAAANGEAIDWDELFEGFAASVDWPGCHFWRELSDRYPDARVLLSLRDSERWYQSVHDTIYPAMLGADSRDLPPAVSAQAAMAREIVLERTFGGRFEDRAHAIGVYERHNQSVREAIAAERLLVYEAAEGWEPLARFLGCPVPDEPFPRVNTSEQFRNRFQP